MKVRFADCVLDTDARTVCLGDATIHLSPLMPLAKGARLGPYEIDALCGSGGMGEVYRAIDTRLLVKTVVFHVNLPTPAICRLRLLSSAFIYSRPPSSFHSVMTLAA